MFDITTLKQNPENPFPFKGTKSEWARFKARVNKNASFLSVRPIAYNSNKENIVVAGNKRFSALIELGWVSTPDKWVVDVKDWSEKQIADFIVEDNSHAEGAEWEMKFVDKEIAEEHGIVYEQDAEPFVAEDDNYQIPEKIKTDIILGDLFEFKKNGLCHRLLCGDSTEADAVNELMGKEYAILMVTDPPYGVNYDSNWRVKFHLNPGKDTSLGIVHNDDKPSWEKSFSLFTGNIAYLWHGSTYSTVTKQNLEDCGFVIKNQIIWNKFSLVISRGNYHWKHEPCWYAVKKGKNHNWQGSRKETTVWDIPRNDTMILNRAELTSHSTQKPIACMAKPIENNTSEGESVYDPFIGSGTTMVAAHQLNRNCYGMEISPEYCQVIVNRMLKLDSQLQVTRNGNDVTDEYRDILNKNHSD